MAESASTWMQVVFGGLGVCIAIAALVIACASGGSSDRLRKIEYDLRGIYTELTSCTPSPLG